MSTVLQNSVAPAAAAATDWLVGGGEMGQLIRAQDWACVSRNCMPFMNVVYRP
jgi:hypothetical protein